MIKYLSCWSPTGVGRHPEILLTVGVGGILAMLIIPFPAPILDVLLASNMAIAALILVAVLLSQKPLAVSSFPTLLLITTLFRLGLNVSTTRMILGEGTAGEVVDAFGSFVARGDVVMGLVVFLVLTLVQLLVIGKGAERVAEVGARFTLDAMPGKQMSIDAALRNGACTEEEAEERRTELGRESQFYGAMDGAMKFVKGDATAGLVVTALNLVAGLAIGVLRFDMSLGEAAETFAILTIGDGLVSQIPSLLIALASGILTTRVAAKVAKSDLGETLRSELLESPKVMALASVFALSIGLVPGLPTLPFSVIAVALGSAAYLVHRRQQTPTGGPTTLANEKSFEAKMEERKKLAKAQKGVSDQLAPTVPLLAIDLEASLSTALGFGQGSDETTELMSTWMSQVRDALFTESGVRLPGVRVRSSVPGLGKNMAMFKVKDVPVAIEKIAADRAVALAPPEELKRIGVDAQPFQNPLTGAPAALIPLEIREAVSGAGIQVWSSSGVIALHLIRVAREHLHHMVGLQETSESLKRLEKVCPDLVRELVPKIVTPLQLRDVLRQLVRERVSIRDLKSILEALGEFGEHCQDTLTLTEHVRAALGMQLAHQLAGSSRRLGVVVLDSTAEDMVRDAVIESPRGTYVALEPELRASLAQSVARTLQPVQRAGVQAVLITHSDIRYFLRKLLESQIADITVVSYEELPDDVVIQALGRVRLEAPELQAA